MNTPKKGRIIAFLTNLLKPYKTNFYEKAILNTKFGLIHMVLWWLNINKS